ncbi:glycosyltransferase family 4 protein [Ekhidna sp.]|uniref:glycosyltransferase family 4 protein n=1 Tax=Ekhidna sp. TaxID=2608089 RepID=UPI0035190D02
MKIAFVANTCWNIYNFRKGLVHHFLSKGDDVIVLAPEDKYTSKIVGWGLTWINTPLDSTGSNPVKDLKYMRRLLKHFKHEKPDIALTFTIKSNIYSSLAGKFSSVPVICNVSGLGTVFLVEGIAGKMAMMLYRIAFKYSGHIFFQNLDDRNLFTSMIKVDDEKVNIIPGSGIDLAHFKPGPIETRDQVRFLMISRLIVEKGVREYAEAASYFKDDERVDFTLIGKFDDGHTRSIERKELDSWIEKGWLSYRSHSDKIIDVINEHDAVVLPSYREGTSRTLLEGAALGKPLLASDVPGCKEVVRDGYNGFLFEVQNAKSMVDKIKLFLSLNKDEREQMAANSRKLVEETFDEEIVIRAYDQVIHRIIKPS